MQQRLNGKVAIVTGGAGGLGREIVRAFVAAGARGVVIVDREEAVVRAVAEEQSGDSTAVLGRAVDVRDAQAMTALTSSVAEELGGLDVMVNNAGVLAPITRMHNVHPQVFRDVLDVNLVGVWNGVVAAYRVMRERGGSVINTASVAGLTAWSHANAYGAAKAGVIHLTKMAAVEYAREQIRVNCVCPGTMNTAMNDALPDGALEQITKGYPLGRLGNADEVAPAYVYLASDESRWTTGSVMVVDGGYSAP